MPAKLDHPSKQAQEQGCSDAVVGATTGAGEGSTAMAGWSSVNSKPSHYKNRIGSRRRGCRTGERGEVAGGLGFGIAGGS